MSWMFWRMGNSPFCSRRVSYLGNYTKRSQKFRRSRIRSDTGWLEDFKPMRSEVQCHEYCRVVERVLSSNGFRLRIWMGERQLHGRWHLCEDQRADSRPRSLDSNFPWRIRGAGRRRYAYAFLSTRPSPARTPTKVPVYKTSSDPIYRLDTFSVLASLHLIIVRVKLWEPQNEVSLSPSVRRRLRGVVRCVCPD
jgi:hypothetical protein